MPDSRGGDDLGVFDDLLKKKEQERAPSQPLIAEPPPAPVPQASAVGGTGRSRRLTPVDDGGLGRGSSLTPVCRGERTEKMQPEMKPAPEPALVPSRSRAAGSGDCGSCPDCGTGGTSFFMGRGFGCPPRVRHACLRSPAVRLSGFPFRRRPPVVFRHRPVVSRGFPSWLLPPTVGSAGPPVSSLTPGSLAPPVLTSSAFTSPPPSPPLPPPPRESVAALSSSPAIASEACWGV